MKIFMVVSVLIIGAAVILNPDLPILLEGNSNQNLSGPLPDSSDRLIEGGVDDSGEFAPSGNVPCNPAKEVCEK